MCTVNSSHISSISKETIALSFSFLNIIDILIVRRVNCKWRSISFLRQASPMSIEVDVNDTDRMYATIAQMFPRKLVIIKSPMLRKPRQKAPFGTFAKYFDILCTIPTVEELTIVIDDSIRSLSSLVHLTRLTSLDIQLSGNSRVDPLKPIGEILSLRRLTLRLLDNNNNNNNGGWCIGRSLRSLTKLEVIQLPGLYGGREDEADDCKISLRDDIPLLPKTLTNLDIHYTNILHSDDMIGWNAFLTIPLTSVSIGLALGPSRIHDLIMRQSNLTCLSCQSMTASNEVSFNRWTNIRELNIRTLAPATLTRCLVDIPSLRTLRCNVGSTGGWDSTTFDGLTGKTTPITTLTIGGNELDMAYDGRGEMGVLHPDNLNALCTMLAPNLTNLCLDYHNGYCDGVSLEMLSAFSSLTSLTIDNYSFKTTTQLPTLPHLVELLLDLKPAKYCYPPISTIVKLYPQLTSLNYYETSKDRIDVNGLDALKLLNGEVVKWVVCTHTITTPCALCVH